MPGCHKYYEERPKEIPVNRPENPSTHGNYVKSMGRRAQWQPIHRASGAGSLTLEIG